MSSSPSSIGGFTSGNVGAQTNTFLTYTLSGTPSSWDFAFNLQSAFGQYNGLCVGNSGNAQFITPAPTQSVYVYDVVISGGTLVIYVENTATTESFVTLSIGGMVV